MPTPQEQIEMQTDKTYAMKLSHQARADMAENLRLGLHSNDHRDESS